MGSLGWLIARLKRSKLVVQMDGIEAWRRPSRLRRAAAEVADLALCLSRYTCACIASWATIAPERICVVPNTVADLFALSDRSGLRTALVLEGKRVLLTVGCIDPRERYKGMSV